MRAKQFAETWAVLFNQTLHVLASVGNGETDIHRDGNVATFTCADDIQTASKVATFAVPQIDSPSGAGGITALVCQKCKRCVFGVGIGKHL